MILGSPQILGPSGLVVSGCWLGPSNKQSRIPETDSRDPETETGGLETGTLEMGLQIVPRSLVAPTRGPAEL